MKLFHEFYFDQRFQVIDEIFKLSGWLIIVFLNVL